MEISFVLTWWMVCLFILAATFTSVWLYSRNRDTTWDLTPVFILFVGFAIVTGIAVGQLFS